MKPSFGFRTLAAAVVLFAFSNPVSADLIFLFTDDGTDTTVNWSGSLDTSGLTVEDPAATNTFFSFNPGLGRGYMTAMSSAPKLRIDAPFASYTAFGNDTAYTTSNASGDEIGLYTFGLDLFLPSGYTSGSPISGSFQILGETRSSMGIVDTPNAYVLTNGAAVHIGPVPEPTSAALLAIGAVGILGWRVLRKRSSDR